jgi:hypothetical protein
MRWSPITNEIGFSWRYNGSGNHGRIGIEHPFEFGVVAEYAAEDMPTYS